MKHLFGLGKNDQRFAINGLGENNQCFAVICSFQEEALMDHRDVVLQAVTLRYSEEEFMKVGTVEVA